MKVKSSLLICMVVFTLVCLSQGVFALNMESTQFGGSTGLISTPTANVGWEDRNVGLDFGFHYINSSDYSVIPAFTVSLFKRLEVGFAADVQENGGNDYLLHSKFNFFPGEKTALAVGFNCQFIKFAEHAKTEYYGQLYVAVTYAGNFFSWPAKTTALLGKTFYKDTDSNIDFSMGFDLDLFPQYLKHYLHWINDFANYSYSVDPNGSNHHVRGCFNTGLRGILPLPDMVKLSIDVICTDVLDSGSRSFAFGLTAGYGF